MNLSPCDKFLGVLTSARQLPFDGASGVFSIIDATIRGPGATIETHWDYWMSLITLQEQGFLRLDKGRKKVLIEAPFVCRSVTVPNEVYLCGARTPEFLKTCATTSKQHGVAFSVKSNGPSLPSQIRLKGNIVTIQNLVQNFDLPFSYIPVSYQTAIQEIYVTDLLDGKRLQGASASDVPSTTISKAVDNLTCFFNTTDITQPDDDISFFNPVSLKYDGKPPTESNPYVHGRRNYQGIHNNLYRLAENGSIQVCTNISKEYAKYYCLSRANCKLGYNEQRRVVLVPKYCRLPLPFARALTLCQCLPPREVHLTDGDLRKLGMVRSSREFLEYQGVPAVIRKIIETRLDIQFQSISYQEDQLICKTQ